jgi:hypothetical protein
MNQRLLNEKVEKRRLLFKLILTDWVIGNDSLPTTMFRLLVGVVAPSHPDC